MNDPCHPAAPAAPPTRFETPAGDWTGHRRRTLVLRYLGAAVASIALLIGIAIPAAAAELMRVTFIRHGESAGNASGLIDTTTPGPVLTPLGQQQARDIADKLGDNNYDGIYASTMVRTQLTAAPMSQYLGLPINVLPGIQEIPAGVFEGTPEADAQGGYGLYPIGWTFPGVIPQIPVEIFNKGTFMPGTTENGFSFDARVDGALQTIYDNGDRNAVVFSHGGTIMFWTMMNVNNLSVMEKLQLLQTAQLSNTDYVVIEGNNEDGWTLVNWNGQQFSPEPTLGAEVKLQFRTLTRQLQATAQEVSAAFATGNIATIATAINRGVADATFSMVKFNRAVNAKIIHEVGQVFTPDAPAVASSDVPTAKTAAATEGGDLTARVKSTLDTMQPQKANVADPTTNNAPKAVDEPEASPLKANDIAAGATDLKDGNKAVPGKQAANRGALTQRLQTAAQERNDQVASSVQKLKDYASKKLAGPAKTAKTGDNANTAAASDAGDSGSQKDAA